jgi:hypothetical protein
MPITSTIGLLRKKFIFHSLTGYIGLIKYRKVENVSYLGGRISSSGKV